MAKELIEYIKGYDILLAGRCLAESDANIKNFKTLIDELFAQIGDKREAAEALGKIGSEKAVDSLIDLLADANSYIRRNAAEALGWIKSEKAVDSLIGLLADKDTVVREIASEALQNIANKLSQSAQDKLVIRLANRNDKDSRKVLEMIKQSTGQRFIKVLEGKKS